MRTMILLIVLAGIQSSCGMPLALSPSPTPVKPAGESQSGETACLSSEPTQDDIDRALSYPSQVVKSIEWDRTYTVSEKRVAVTWKNNLQGAILHLEALIFPCGYGEQDLDEYFSEANWGIILLKYADHQLLAQCKSAEGLRLYQFQAQNQGINYILRYWVRPDTEARVIVVMLVFPVGVELTLDTYAARLFPDLKTCPCEWT